MEINRIKFLRILLMLAFMGVLSVNSIVIMDQNLTFNLRNMETCSLRNSGVFYANDEYVDSYGYTYIYIGYLQKDRNYSISFSNSNDQLIEVQLVDDYNFNKFIDGSPYTYHDMIFFALPRGTAIDNKIPISDEYYILFKNVLGELSTYISYYITTYPDTFSNNSNNHNPININLISIISIVLISTIGAAIIITLIILAIRKNFKKTRIRSPPSQNLLNQKNEIVYCNFCGEQTTRDAKFCPKCGSKL